MNNSGVPQSGMRSLLAPPASWLGRIGGRAAAAFLLAAVFTAAAVITPRLTGAGALAGQEPQTAANNGGVPERVAAFAWIRPQEGVLVIAGPANDFGYRIAHLGVKEGDMVKAGQPLAELDVKRERAATLAVTTAKVEEAKVNAEYTGRQLARKEALFGTSAHPVSVQELDTAKESAGLARARLETAKRQRAYAQIMLDQATIRAPAAGMVLHVLKHEGEGFTPGQGLVELGQVTHMEAVAEVFETDVRFVKPGQAATFKSPALPAPIEGKVLRILPKTERVSLYQTNAAANTEARVVRVIVALKDIPEVRRLTGLQGIVTIVTSTGS
jgi:HlyD family secretion protein